MQRFPDDSAMAIMHTQQSPLAFLILGPTMRRGLCWRALSRVNGAEQIGLERLSWTMRCEDQSARQTVSQLKRCVVESLQRCARGIVNEM